MTRTTTLAKVALTTALCLFALLVIAGGVGVAIYWPTWAWAIYAAGALWFGFTTGEAIGEVWTCDLRDLTGAGE